MRYLLKRRDRSTNRNAGSSDNGSQQVWLIRHMKDQYDQNHEHAQGGCNTHPISKPEISSQAVQHVGQAFTIYGPSFSVRVSDFWKRCRSIAQPTAIVRMSLKNSHSWPASVLDVRPHAGGLLQLRVYEGLGEKMFRVEDRASGALWFIHRLLMRWHR
ncbi:hypothetical protein [Bradyrhizobium genosp. P]|uniref:hypothetical protein n=1 Tax=Bradyrhizobium genosp. P TaxID=83641 RepID=UPI003CF40037